MGGGGGRGRGGAGGGRGGVEGRWSKGSGMVVGGGGQDPRVTVVTHP